jgi:hypothetical protein
MKGIVLAIGIACILSVLPLAIYWVMLLMRSSKERKERGN